MDKQRNEVDFERIDPYQLEKAKVYSVNDREEIRKQFKEHGFVVISNVFDSQQVNELTQVFETINPICTTFSQDESDTLKKYPRVMMPHRTYPTTRNLMIHPTVTQFIDEFFQMDQPPVDQQQEQEQEQQQVNGKSLAAQSMFYYKPPKAKGQSLHQDNFYLRVEPGNCLAAWTAIDDTDAENGAMYLIPRTNRAQLVCPGDADPETSFTIHYVPIPNNERPLLAEMKSGDTLFFNGNVIHGSAPNFSTNRFRRSFICHYVPSNTVTISHQYLPLVNQNGDDVLVSANEKGNVCGQVRANY